MICNSVANLQMSNSMFSKEMRIAVMTGLMSAVFLLCWLPFFILNIYAGTPATASV